MNNKTASMIRDFGIARVDVEGTVYFCEVDFVAKQEDYSPDYDVSKYAEKVARMEKAQKELTERKAKKAKKTE